MIDRHCVLHPETLMNCRYPPSITGGPSERTPVEPVFAGDRFRLGTVKNPKVFLVGKADRVFVSSV